MKRVIPLLLIAFAAPLAARADRTNPLENRHSREISISFQDGHKERDSWMVAGQIECIFPDADGSCGNAVTFRLVPSENPSQTPLRPRAQTPRQ